MPLQPNPNMVIMQYLNEAKSILPGVDPENLNYKQQVGECIYSHVEKLTGEEKAPKITGMLIDLPIEEIKDYLVDFN